MSDNSIQRISILFKDGTTKTRLRVQAEEISLIRHLKNVRLDSGQDNSLTYTAEVPADRAKNALRLIVRKNYVVHACVLN